MKSAPTAEPSAPSGSARDGAGDGAGDGEMITGLGRTAIDGPAGRRR